MFEGEDFHEFRSFVAIRESFLRKILGRGVLWHRSNPQKFSPRKLYFSPIRKSFLPRKFSAARYATEYCSISTWVFHMYWCLELGFVDY